MYSAIETPLGFEYAGSSSWDSVSSSIRRLLVECRSRSICVLFNGSCSVFWDITSTDGVRTAYPSSSACSRSSCCLVLIFLSLSAILSLKTSILICKSSAELGASGSGTIAAVLWVFMLGAREIELFLLDNGGDGGFPRLRSPNPAVAHWVSIHSRASATLSRSDERNAGDCCGFAGSLRRKSFGNRIRSRACCSEKRGCRRSCAAQNLPAPI